jgi:adenylate cyclase
MATRDTPKTAEIEKVIEGFADGIAAYRVQDWDTAIAKFNHILEIWPDDEPSKVYVARCERFKSNQPGREWDGVYTMKTK